MSIVIPCVNPYVIPLELRERRTWCVWRYYKGAKVPRRVDDTGNAVLKNPSTLASFEDAFAAFQSPPFKPYDGIALYLTRQDATYCLDLDSCISNGFVSQWATSIWHAVPSYCELSPSGTGIKIFANGSVPRWINCRKSYRLAEFVPATAQKNSECLVIREGLVTVTGHTLQGIQSALIDDRGALNRLCEAWERKLPTRYPVSVTKKSQTLIPPASIAEAIRRLKGCNMPAQEDDGSRLLYSLVFFMLEHWHYTDNQIHTVINQYHSDSPIRMLDGSPDDERIIQTRIEQAKHRMQLNR